MATIAQINAKVDAAVAAQEEGDYATALAYLRSARMMLAAKPDSGSAGESLRWDRPAIEAMIRDLAKARNASAGIQRGKVEYLPTPADDE
jgi:hypothetical protein